MHNQNTVWPWIRLQGLLQIEIQSGECYMHVCCLSLHYISRGNGLKGLLIALPPRVTMHPDQMQPPTTISSIIRLAIAFMVALVIYMDLPIVPAITIIPRMDHLGEVGNW
jgi:hypothetical protein